MIDRYIDDTHRERQQRQRGGKERRQRERGDRDERDGRERVTPRDRQLDKEKRKNELTNLQRFLPSPLRSYL